MTAVKICGLKDDAAVEAAVEGGADFVGAVFFEPSPRNIDPEAAAELFDPVPEDVKRVGLFVDPTDDVIEGVVRHLRLDFLQLHGSETPERVEAIGLEFGIPLIKAIGIENASDVDRATDYADMSDWLLLDAKPPKGADRPGGNAQAFDWTLLEDFKAPVPWMLAGGLTPDNVVAALQTTKAPAVDVSSGVEKAPGVKDPALITRFLEAVKGGA